MKHNCCNVTIMCYIGWTVNFIGSNGYIKKKTHQMVGQFMASRRGIEPLLQE